MDTHTPCMLKVLFDLDNDRSSIFFPPLPNHKQDLFATPLSPQNAAPSFPLLPIEDLQVIGFSFVSIATLALSTIYSRASAPPLVGDRRVLAAATPEPAGARNSSLSLNLETPLPLMALAKNWVSFSPICL